MMYIPRANEETINKIIDQGVHYLYLKTGAIFILSPEELRELKTSEDIDKEMGVNALLSKGEIEEVKEWMPNVPQLSPPEHRMLIRLPSGTAVNVQAIRKVKGEDVQFTNEVFLPLSQEERDELEERLFSL